jgi:hypothetical protein
MKRFILAILAISAQILIFLMCCGIPFGVLVFLESVSDRQEEKTNLFNQLYSIEPQSLLDDLEQGKSNVFSPIDERPPWPPLDQQIPVPWTQGDYLQITNSLFEFIWNDTLVGWQLTGMSFGLGCTDTGTGFQNGIFTFFKNEEEANGQKFRIERSINIDSRNKTVYIAEDRYVPRLVDWSSIELKHNPFTADDILQIAENAGGQAKRLSVENDCDIAIGLSPDSARYNGWWVRYSQRGDDATLFRADIDPVTGEVDIP